MLIIMASKPRILFQTGAPSFHPVAEQAEQVRHWLADLYDVVPLEGNAFFEELPEADLVVIGGLQWTGGPELTFVDPIPYRTPSETEKQAWRDYVGSGKPVCGFHGGIASYDDWPEFGKLLGFQWIWGVTLHSRVDTWTVKPREGHAITKGLSDFSLVDELYYNVCPANDMGVQVHADADYHGITFPMLMTGNGGRCPGAGKTAYMANGHDMRAFECPAMKTLFQNTFRWLLSTDPR